MEYVYKLNLPSLASVARPSLWSLIENNNKNIVTIKPKDYFSEEILNIKNLNWKNGDGVYFKKNPNFYGAIHIDGSDGKFRWGLNWVIGGEGGMDYWDGPLEKIPTIDSAGRTRLDVYPTTPPNKTYLTIPDNVYLVNASVPHRGFNTSFTQHRHAISIRPEHSLSWDLVVNLFSDLIID